jgi:hypothetical protein
MARGYRAEVWCDTCPTKYVTTEASDDPLRLPELAAGLERQAEQKGWCLDAGTERILCHRCMRRKRALTGPLPEER